MVWKKIEDRHIRHTWRCPECKFEVMLPPTFYTDNGTPICDCGEDMEYSHSEIDCNRMIAMSERN